jgi:hypothetical protein
MIQRIKLVALTVCLLLRAFNYSGQQMPASATVIMNPPHPVYLSDYYAIGSNAFQTLLTLNDLNEPFWDVKLRVTIEGEGIKITTKPSFTPLQPITLTSGIPMNFQGSDFAPYLNVNNVDLQGITATSLNQSGKLPEGLYQFCVEILDYQTGIPLSLQQCATVFIFFEPPPVTLLPACQSILTPMTPQNIFFTWQIAGGASPTIAINSKYKLFLYEITNNSYDPYFAVENNHALLVYESDFINQTSLSLDFGINTTSLLVPGKKYAYRIRAVDADEKNIYRNNGYSEWCWFFYGYPNNGKLTINSPVDQHVFGKYENKSFGWQASDLGVPGQQYEYVFTIKELNPNQDPTVAIDQNPVWFSQITPTTSSATGYGINLTQPLEEGKSYIWQVTAFTGEQEVAKSNVYTFYAPSLVDQFYAGNNVVKVITIHGSDLTDVSGRGKMQLSPDSEDWLEFDFEHLNIEDMNGEMILVGGTAQIDLSDRPDLELNPELEENGKALFKYNVAKISSTGVKINGSVVWQFPHATTDGNLAFVESIDKDFSIDASYNLNGQAAIKENMEFELLEPYEFKLKLNSQSDFVLANGKYKLRLKGELLTNQNVKTNDGNPYKLNFNNQPSLFYLEANSLLSFATNHIQPANGLNFGFMPKNAIIDLSDIESPEKFSGLPTWKGVYFSDYQVRFYANNTDATNQLKIGSNIDRHENLSNTDFWLTNQGLFLKYQFELEEPNITFNGFKTYLTGKIEIEDNQITNSYIKGKIKLPVIHRTDEFSFEIPITNDGLGVGYLNEDLTLRNLVFNPFGGENRINVTINRAVFADNERIDLEIDAELTGISATAQGISDFRIYGDNTIGFGKRGGSKPLDVRVYGEYKGFVTVVTEMGAALFNGNYVLSYLAEVEMGEGTTGEDGPPVLAVSSAEAVGSETDLPTFSPSNPQPVPTISIPEDIDPDQSTLTSHEMFVSMDNSLVSIEGYLKLTNNDPNWGTSFQGGIAGELKIPGRIECGANLIFGDREGTKFWYFDAFFNDREGAGIPVPPLFNIVALEGRIYHHMSKQGSSFLVDPDLAFGAAMYMQLIDNQMTGRLFAVDAGVEIKVLENGDFTIAMSGDGSFLNMNARTPNGGVTSAVGQEVANQVIEAIGPIEFDVSVGGGTLTVKAEGLTAGSLTYSKDDLEFGISADVSSTPGVGLNFAKGGTSFGFEANASGNVGLEVGIDGNTLGLGLQGTDGGYFDFSYDEVTLGMNVALSQKTGSFNFGYGDKSVGIGIGKTQAHLNMELSSDLKFETGFNTAGSAYLGMVIGTDEFKISGDKEDRSGEIKLTIDGVSLNVGANLTEKSGDFGFTAGGVELGVGAVAEKSGYFNLKENGNEYGIGINLETQSGNIVYSYDGGNKQFRASIENGDEGKLFFKHNDTEFGIGGNAEATKGYLSFASGSNSFSIEADSEENTGGVAFEFDDNSLDSYVSPDSCTMAFNLGGVGFSSAIYNNGTGSISLENNGNKISVSGNPSEQEAEMEIIVGSNEFSAKTSLESNEHELKVQTSGNVFEIDYTDNVKLIKFASDGNFEIYGSQNNDDYEVGTVVSNHTLKAGISEGNAQIAYEGMGTKVVFNETFIQLTHNNETIKISEEGVLINGQTPSEIVNNAQFNITKSLSGLDVNLSAASGTYGIGFSKDGNSIEVSTVGFEDGEVTLTYNGNEYSISKDGEKYAVGYNDYGVSYEAGTLELTQGDNNSLKISTSSVEMNYDNYSFTITENEFTYEDGENEVEISEEKLKLKRGEYGVYVQEDGFGLDIGASKHLYLTETSADFKYNSYEAKFVDNQSLSLTDGTRSLQVTEESFLISDGSKSMEMGQKDDAPYIKLTNDADFFEVSTTGFAIEYDGKRYAISETENLNIEVDDQSYVEIMNNGVKYVYDDKEFIIGGNDNFIEIKDSERSFSLTQEGAIAYNEGSYSASLSQDFEVNFSDGTRDIVIFSENEYFSYNQSDYGFKIRKPQGNRPKGVEVNVQGYSVFVEGESNKDVTVGVSGPNMGEMSVSVDAKKDIAARFKDGQSVYGFIKQGSTFTPINGTEPAEPEPEYLAGSGSAEAMDGPTLITNSISGEAGGRIKGKAELSYNSATNTFIANAAVAGTSPVCIEGAMSLKVTSDEFALNIGTEQQRIEIYPTCTGFGGGGWLGLVSNSTATTIDVGVFAGWKAGGTVSIGTSTVGASLTATASAELGVAAKAEIIPDFKLLEAKVWVDIKAELRAGYWFIGSSGSFTIAALGLSGNLAVKFEDKTNVSGQLSGYINILDVIEESFNMGFNTSF